MKIPVKYFYALSGLIHIALVFINISLFGYIPNEDPDAVVYIARAKEYAQGWYTNPVSNWNFAPGYSIFLMLAGAFNNYSPYILAALQSSLYVWACCCFTDTLKKESLLSENKVKIYFFILLLHPNILFTNERINSECLTASLLLLSTSYLIRIYFNLSNKKAIQYSLLMSLLIITRYEYSILFFLSFFLLLFRHKFSHLVRLSLILIFPVFFLIINGVRNYYTFNVFNVFSFSGGSVIYGGNNTNLDGSWHSIGLYEKYVPEKFQTEFRELIADTNFIHHTINQDKLFKKMALDAWKEAPLAQLGVIPVKFSKLWLVPGQYDIYTGDTEMTRGLQLYQYFNPARWPWYGVWKHIFYFLLHWLTLLLIAAGFIISIRETEAGILQIVTLALFLVITGLFSVLFYGLPRFHTTIIPILLLYTAYPITFVYNRITGKLINGSK